MSMHNSKYQKLTDNSAFLFSFIRGWVVRRIIVNHCAKLGFLLLFFVLSFQSFSQIEVGGTMTSSETWTNENVYIVVQDLIVPEGVILIIEEGVEVRVNYGRGITVNNGAIRVLGTHNSIVRFIPNHTSLGQGWKWRGISVVNANISHETYINYAKVTMAEIAIRLEGCENVLIENSELTDCQNLGVQFINSSFCSIVSCKIEGNYDGIEVLTSTLGVSANNVIEKCIIRNQNHNIYIFREEDAWYRHNLIAENIIESGNNGIWINYLGETINYKNTIKHNIIINNGANVGYGMYLAHDSTIVENNIFWKNNIALFCEQKADNCFINNNSFYHNDRTIAIGSGSENSNYLNNTFSINSSELFGISETNNVLSYNNILHSCKLENIVFNNTNVNSSIPDNYWGTTDTSIINRMIYDKLDNPVLGKLNYVPYLTDIDTTNPVSPPYNIVKQVVDGKVRVSWYANQEQDLMGYRLYYGDYADYSFSEKLNVGMDTSFVLATDISINDSIAATAFDSTITQNNNQLLGHESPFAIAVVYPFAGHDTIICKNITELKIENVTIPFASQGLFWSTSGDGIFNNPNSPSPTYFPGILDVQNYGVILALNVKNVAGDTLTDEFTLSIYDDPIAFAGNDTIVVEDEDIHLVEASAVNFESIIWITNGDGNFDNITLVNPTYFPGDFDNELGVVLLEMLVYSKCGSASDSVTILIEPYYSVEGKLWASQKAVNPGIVIAFKEDDEGVRAMQIESVDTYGTFKFEKLMEGNYYMYALPDTNNVDYTVPGYYANKLRWQSAYLLPVYANVFDVDIYLQSTDFILPVGEGSISGHMEQPEDSKYSSDIYCMPWFENSTSEYCNNGLSNITVLLFNNTSTKLLDYTLTDELGNFYFSQLPFGEYIVDAEKAGFSSFPSPVITLSPEHKNESGVVLQISQQKLAISLHPSTSNQLSTIVYPNPASAEINIPYSNPLLLSSQIEVYDLFGNRVLSSDIPIDKTSSTIKLDISKLTSGLYFGQIINSIQTIHFRFIK